MATLYEELQQTKPLPLEDEAFLNVLRTAQLLEARHAAFLKQFGVTPTQYNVLRIVRGAGDEGIMCRSIGERMITFDPDLTSLLGRMQARGWVKRKKCPHDGRVSKVSLTTAGKRLVEKVTRAADDDIHDYFQHMPQKEIRELSRLLERVREE